MLKMKKFFLLAMLASAFVLITSCGGGAGDGSDPEDEFDKFRAEGIEFNYTMTYSAAGLTFQTGISGGDPAAYAGILSMMGNPQTTTGTIGAKGDTLWTSTSQSNPLNPSENIVTKQIVKINSDGKTATQYLYDEDDTLIASQEINFEESMKTSESGQATAMLTSEPDFSSFTKSGTKVVAGKTCDLYIGKGEAEGSEFAYWSERKITLYVNTTAEGIDVEFEITSIKFGNDVIVPQIQ